MSEYLIILTKQNPRLSGGKPVKYFFCTTLKSFGLMYMAGRYASPFPSLCLESKKFRIEQIPRLLDGLQYPFLVSLQTHLWYNRGSGTTRNISKRLCYIMNTTCVAVVSSTEDARDVYGLLIKQVIPRKGIFEVISSFSQPPSSIWQHSIIIILHYQLFTLQPVLS